MAMMLKLPVGIDNFKKLRTAGFYYVDKTELIKELLENWGDVNLFTRPRRFGKTLNMSMLKYFFEIGADSGLFQGLEIAKENINLIEKNIFFEVQDAYINMVQFEKQIPLYKKRVYQALENFELADGRYGTGLSNFIELQDARSQYLNSQQEYVQTIYNYNIAKAKLEAAIGEI